MRLHMWVAVTLLVISLAEFGEAGQARAVPFVAIIVYAHGFAKGMQHEPNGNVVPLNKTSSFTQDDKVYAYVTATLTSANFTWAWYDPTGQLYLNQTTQAECVISPCTLAFELGYVPATKLGLWRLDLLANGYKLYSDYFTVTPVITQDNYWNFDVTQSAPSRVHGELTVTIHPDNATWSSYAEILPNAVNLTAFEPVTNRSLAVATLNNSRIIVDLGGPRSDGYTFVLGFDLPSELDAPAGWSAGIFEFTWHDFPWERPFPEHPLPESFSITLPPGASVIDVVGINALTLNETITGGERLTISFRTMVPPEQPFGWSIIYRDTRNLQQPSEYTSTTSAGLNLVAGQRFPVLPLTVGGVSLWSAIMSAFLLIGSELLSPIYAGIGIAINRRRLRFVAMIFVLIFLATTAYQVIASIPAPSPSSR